MLGMPATDPAIAKVAEAYASAVNAGDAAAAAAVFAPDGVEMPPGRPAIRGREAIEQFYASLFRGPARVSAFRLAHRDSAVAGDFAFLTGTSTRTMSLPGAAPMEQAGKYLVVLRRTEGTWQVVDAIYNADGPCPPEPAAGR